MFHMNPYLVNPMANMLSEQGGKINDDRLTPAASANAGHQSSDVERAARASCHVFAEMAFSCFTRMLHSDI